MSYVTRSANTQHNHTLSNSILLNIYNLHTLAYASAIVQPHMPKSLGNTGLQSSNINLYSKYWENKSPS